MFNILFLCVIPAFAIEPWDLLPAPGQTPGLFANEKTSCINENVRDTAKLYSAIDGGADVYIRNGFCKGAFNGFFLDSVETCVEIYDQGSSAGARKLFDSTATGEYRKVQSTFAVARIDTSSPFATMFEGVCDWFYVRLSQAVRNMTAETALAELAGEIKKRAASGK